MRLVLAFVSIFYWTGCVAREIPLQAGMVPVAPELITENRLKLPDGVGSLAAESGDWKWFKASIKPRNGFLCYSEKAKYGVQVMVSDPIVDSLPAFVQMFLGELRQRETDSGSEVLKEGTFETDIPIKGKSYLVSLKLKRADETSRFMVYIGQIGKRVLIIQCKTWSDRDEAWHKALAESYKAE